MTNSYVYYQPIYSTTAEIKEAVALLPPREIKNPGKIYFKDGYLYINEPDSGIHIIDNRDPRQPRPLSFLNLPGNVDLAIRENTLYADSYIDLVVFDISNIAQVHEVGRVEGVFDNVIFSGFYYDQSKGVVTSFERVKTVNITESDCEMSQQPWGGVYYADGIALNSMSSFAESSTLRANFSAPQSTKNGVAGSMAKFALANNYLYALDGSQLKVLDISVSVQPLKKNEMQLGWDVETLFPYNGHLFVGSQTGMYILSLFSPESPAQISKYEHIRSCDPVVVEGNYAFVTLRSGTTCAGFSNQLEVIDISNLSAPQLINVYPMTHPNGLGIDNGTLFICDDTAGLKIYDASDVNQIADHLLAQYAGIHAFDVIPFQNNAMVVGSDGLYQYDYSDINNIKLISQIPIVRQ